MLMRNKAEFARGFLLLGSFLVVLFLIFSNVFTASDGQKINGLDFADRLFNSLSKGSSYFIPELQNRAAKLQGKTYNVTVKLKKAETVDKAVAIFTKAGLQATGKDATLTVSGDLTTLANKVMAASDAMYHNNANAVSEEYGMDGRVVMETYWEVLSASIKELQKARQIEESKLVDALNKKGIEPAYNFYGIQSENIMDKIGLSAGLLVFYVVYTMWYGFALVFMLEGVGLSMKKAKVKQEV